MGIDTESEVTVESSGTGVFIVRNLIINDPDAVGYLDSLDDSNRLNAISVAIRFGLLALRDFQSISNHKMKNIY